MYKHTQQHLSLSLPLARTIHPPSYSALPCTYIPTLHWPPNLPYTTTILLHLHLHLHVLLHKPQPQHVRLSHYLPDLPLPYTYHLTRPYPTPICQPYTDLPTLSCTTPLLLHTRTPTLTRTPTQAQTTKPTPIPARHILLQLHLHGWGGGTV